MSNLGNWDTLWQETKLSFTEDRVIIDDEIHSLRFKRIEKEINKRFGSFKKLDVIEVGSGRGEVALIMALKGAKVTLLDSSSFALSRANELFKHFNLSPEVIQSNIFSIPASLLGKFDISMSFGLVEHFLYPQRKEAIGIHYKLLGAKGVSFISVPNRFCLAYWIFRALAKVSGHWKMGLERPFSFQELLHCAKEEGFQHTDIFGSSSIKDTLHFLFFKPLFHLMDRERSFSLKRLEIPTFLDNSFSAYLTLMGEKK